MATQRKIAARGKATSTRKAARPARAAARPAAKPKARATGSARPAAKAAVKPAPKPALKPGAKVARVIGRPAVKGDVVTCNRVRIEVAATAGRGVADAVVTKMAAPPRPSS